MESIKALVATSKALGEVIVTLQKTAAAPETIKQLEDTRNNITKSADEIVQNTDKMFKSYKEMVDCL